MVPQRHRYHPHHHNIMLIDLLFVFCLIILNGILAMTELAVVSSRRSKLQAQANNGNKGAKIALELKDDPSKFLSTVQIGITMIGIFSGAFSGVTIAGPLGDYLTFTFPALTTYGDDLAIVLVVTVITYLSLVIGELVPKQIALRYADSAAIAIAVPIYWLSRITRPLVLLLDASNKLVLTLLSVKVGGDSPVSAEEVKAVIAEGTEAGALEPEEKQMLDRVMRLDNIGVKHVMTHRRDMIWLEVNEPSDSVLEKVRTSRHTRYPVCRDSVENLLGILVVKDLLLQLSVQDNFDLQNILYQPMHLPDTATILEALEQFKRSTATMAIVVNEYGGLEGIVTLKDMMEAIVGTLPEPAHREDYQGVQRNDGSWLLDGGLSIHEAEEMLGISTTEDGSESYTTVAGLMLDHFGHIPREGDEIIWQGLRFEVIDMDNNRIDKVLVSQVTH
jgi:putative hemolysin